MVETIFTEFFCLQKRGAFDEKLFFPYIGYSWPNVNKVQDLKKYLARRLFFIKKKEKIGTL